MTLDLGLRAYRVLGRSGLRVAPLCLGSMAFGASSCDARESANLIDVYADAGGNFIDTAPGYGRGASEEIVGRSVAKRRDRFVVATKFSFIGGSSRAELGGNSRKAIVKNLEASLRRLGTDYLDVFFLHAWEGLTPIDEVLRALDDLVGSGKILYAGADQTPAWKLSQANTFARLSGLTPFIAYQGPYNLVERSAERDLLPMAREHGLSFLAHSPLANGLLSGKYRQGASGQAHGLGAALLEPAGFSTPNNFAIADVVAEIADECGRAPAQVALAWLITRADKPIPVLGVRNVSQLRENLQGLGLVLSPEQIERLDAMGRLELGHPHGMLAKPMVQQGMVGASYSVHASAFT